MKSETSGVIWHVAPESKIQLVHCELSAYFSLERLLLLDIRAIDAYILWSFFIYVVVACTITFFIKTYLSSPFLLSFGGLGHFAIM